MLQFTILCAPKTLYNSNEMSKHYFPSFVKRNKLMTSENLRQISVYLTLNRQSKRSIVFQKLFTYPEYKQS